MPSLSTHYPTFSAFLNFVVQELARAIQWCGFVWLGKHSRQLASRLFRPLTKLVTVLAPLLLLAPGYWCNPVTDTLPGPRFAVLRSTVPGLELGVVARWYDFGLSKQIRQQDLLFGSTDTLQLPDYKIRTTSFRLSLKRYLIPRGDWTECENCYGPIVYVSLYNASEYSPPEKTRLTQNQQRLNDTVYFDVSLIADETQFEERPLQVRNLVALMSEVRAILAAGTEINIPAKSYGPELRHLNPVRAERERESLVVWMGGNVGYSITPDAAGGPFIHQAFVMGTEHPGIQKIERF